MDFYSDSIESGKASSKASKDKKENDNNDENQSVSNDKTMGKIQFYYNSANDKHENENNSKLSGDKKKKISLWSIFKLKLSKKGTSHTLKDENNNTNIDSLKNKEKQITKIKGKNNQVFNDDSLVNQFFEKIIGKKKLEKKTYRNNKNIQSDLKPLLDSSYADEIGHHQKLPNSERSNSNQENNAIFLHHMLSNKKYIRKNHGYYDEPGILQDDYENQGNMYSSLLDEDENIKQKLREVTDKKKMDSKDFASNNYKEDEGFLDHNSTLHKEDENINEEVKEITKENKMDATNAARYNSDQEDESLSDLVAEFTEYDTDKESKVETTNGRLYFIRYI
jgi:hypothetical protein